MIRHFRNFLIAGLVAVLASVSLVKAHRDNQSVVNEHDNVKVTALVDADLIKSYQALITPESLAARLYFFASDFFEGRETTTRGQKLAAEYLASEYRQLGLTPRGTEKPADPLAPSAFYQPFTLYREAIEHSKLEVKIKGETVASSEFSETSHDDLSFFAMGNHSAVSGNVVFAGYGIADDALHYNDYSALTAKGISLKDKWVMIMDHEPLVDAAISALPTVDHKPSIWTKRFEQKRYALWKAGMPRGVLVVGDLSPLNTQSFDDKSREASADLRRVGKLFLAQKSALAPVFEISSKLANKILEPSKRTIGDLKKTIDSTLKPESFEVDNSVTISAAIDPSSPVRTENVLAYIEGTDPKLKNEVLVISAHYDHLGLNPTLKGDQIFNGAADDGSGVVASLKMAELFMKAKSEGHGPRRSILFANFSGEEKGTLGSLYYASNPVIPYEQLVANINMDGVGGIDMKHPTGSRNYVYLVGTKDLSTELTSFTKEANEKLSINLELTGGQTTFSSDHESFANQFIPFLYFSTGRTEKYHRVDDHADTIDYEHFARIVRLTFATAWQAANQDHSFAKVDRKLIKLSGYACRPCGFSCDNHVLSEPGECPVCGMALRPIYTLGAPGD